MDNIKLLYIDLFCGAGGTSTGVENARYGGRQCAKVIGCVNHDANAIASHAANHPDAMHFTEDIRTLELSPLITHIAKMREQYPGAFVVLWASLECTNFSKAKGGVLSVRQWIGRPYYKPGQESIVDVLADVIGVQRLQLWRTKTATLYDWTALVHGRPVPIEVLSANDGLTVEDFKSWFAPAFKKAHAEYLEFAIIQFTKLRY